MSAQPVYIWLSGTPRGKGRPRFVRATGRAYTPAETASYESALRLAAQSAMYGREMIFGPVRVSIVAQFEIPMSFTKKARREIVDGTKRPTKKPDFDNIAKVVGDALNGLVFHDDAQITDAVFAKRYSSEPGLAIEVREI